MKKFIFAAVSIFLILSSNSFIFAEDANLVSSSRRIDLSAGKIQAETCDFSMNIPAEWKEYLRAYHEYLPLDSRMMEKIEFYFFPVDKTAKPVRLLSINIYDKQFWTESGQWKLLFESENYIFTIYTVNREYDFDYTVDKIIYSYYEEKFSDINFLRSLMTFPEKEDITENSVIIGNVILKNAVVYNNKNMAYIPVRLCCETLGYEVSWDQASKNIIISRNGFKFTLVTRDGPQKSYNTFLLDGSYYVSVFFFMNALNTGIEIDERGNVYITK